MAAGERKVWLALLALVMMALAWPAQALPQRLSKRAVSAGDMANFRGAILVKNGAPTTCELALIDNKAAFVAATCLSLSGKRLKDDSTRYEIYFDGAKGNRPAKVTVDASDISIHPKFNPNTYSNNLAILQFSFTDQSSWVNYIAAYRGEWTDIAYVRRQVSANNDWSTPRVRSYAQTDANCDRASGLFRYNEATLMCARIYTPSTVTSSSCNMPYGSVYGVTSSSMAIAGLYSHSVVYGTGMCGGSATFHYYVVLTEYLPYARTVLGRKPKEFVEDDDGLSDVRRIDSFYMKHAQSPNDDGTYMFTGDMISPRAGVPGPNPPTAAATTTPAGSKPPATTAAGSKPAATTTPTTPAGSNNTNGNGGNTGNGNDTGNDTGDNDAGNNVTGDNDAGNNDTGDSDAGNNGSPDEQQTKISDDEGLTKINNDDGDLTKINDDGELGLVQDDTSEPSASASLSASSKFSDPADNSQLYGDSLIDDGLLDSEIPPASNVDALFDNAYNGLSKGAVIGMAVAIPLGTILLVVIAFILYKMYNRERRQPVWRKASVKRQNNVHALIDEIGGASQNEPLPAYDELHQPNTPRSNLP
ncbi:hypothetical protein H4S02_002026 [Coemansia sp. RSA 2611]|nr:hypothetical protein H4S02_002026 [Coemansia sp. RSA 2611]